eukprot:comp18486_c0_seq1/m.19861 comp18486_c0_seq1/g.19861  ORF comp18486_c0_seq1/g.19861 comp18486_c0_seq1/m.19861 type:complete len:319 (-) comp18486_c0_seq1:675-1631(-)
MDMIFCNESSSMSTPQISSCPKSFDGVTPGVPFQEVEEVITVQGLNMDPGANKDISESKTGCPCTIINYVSANTYVRADQYQASQKPAAVATNIGQWGEGAAQPPQDDSMFYVTGTVLALSVAANLGLAAVLLVLVRRYAATRKEAGRERRKLDTSEQRVKLLQNKLKLTQELLFKTTDQKFTASLSKRQSVADSDSPRPVPLKTTASFTDSPQPRKRVLVPTIEESDGDTTDGLDSPTHVDSNSQSASALLPSASSHTNMERKNAAVAVVRTQSQPVRAHPVSRSTPNSPYPSRRPTHSEPKKRLEAPDWLAGEVGV